MKSFAFLIFFNACLLSTPVLAVGDTEAGSKIFPRLCGGCHQIGESARPGFGPVLNDIFGRAAGTSANYVYSDAMKNSGVTWDTATLTAYLQDPKGVVPGTRMIFWGLSDQEKIDNLLAYLQSFSALPANHSSTTPHAGCDEAAGCKHNE